MVEGTDSFPPILSSPTSVASAAPTAGKATQDRHCQSPQISQSDIVREISKALGRVEERGQTEDMRDPANDRHEKAANGADDRVDAGPDGGDDVSHFGFEVCGDESGWLRKAKEGSERRTVSAREQVSKTRA